MLPYAFCSPILNGGFRALQGNSLGESSWAVSARASPLNHVSARRPTHAVIVAADSALKLPTELDRLVDRFATVPDAKLRYQQLLFFAQKLPTMDPTLKTEANRVRGCTSVVHVHVELDENRKVQISADSDAQLTKGLVALLVNGLGGCSIEEVLAIDPSFIVASGLSISLTPSRNNGFINMVSKIKEKVVALRDGVSAENGNRKDNKGAVDPLDGNGVPDTSLRPRYSSILRKLSALEPTELEVQDTSHLHAGHPGNTARASPGSYPESHFVVRIVSDKFKDLSLVTRHRLIYKLLAAEMMQAHALNIEALTEYEAAQKAQ